MTETSDKNVLPFKKSEGTRVPMEQRTPFDVSRGSGIIASVNSLMVAPNWFDDDPHKELLEHQLTKYPQVEATEALRLYLVSGNANTSPRMVYSRYVYSLLMNPDSHLIIIDGYPSYIIRTLAQTMARNACGMCSFPDADRTWFPIREVVASTKDKAISNLGQLVNKKLGIPIDVPGSPKPYTATMPSVYFSHAESWEEMQARITEAESLFTRLKLNILNLHTSRLDTLFPELAHLFAAQQAVSMPRPVPAPQGQTPPPPPSAPTTPTLQ